VFKKKKKKEIFPFLLDYSEVIPLQYTLI